MSARIRPLRQIDFIDFARVVITYMDDWSNSAQQRTLLALDACAGLKEESDKKYRLWQTVELNLWEFPEAVENGFHKFYKDSFTERLEALHYHDANCVNTAKCDICKVIARWCK